MSYLTLAENVLQRLRLTRVEKMNDDLLDSGDIHIVIHC
ncbi:hypothetical protein EJP617_33300 [Erwinia sp. Ejp617]|nr:hypothetical protein EJP617_33300 [Erwinia sp. Ejp617]